MFTQPVSMYCIKEWYEKDLRQPLLDMGYEWIDTSRWNNPLILVNNYSGVLGWISNVPASSTRYHNRYFIDHYNPKLFLALAAMTTKKYGIKGEWWKYIGINQGGFKNGSLYLSRTSIDNPLALIDEKGQPNGFYSANLNHFKKATKEDLIKKFTMENKELFTNLLIEGRIVVNENGARGVVIGNSLKIILWGDGCMTDISDIKENPNDGFPKLIEVRERSGLRTAFDFMDKNIESTIIWKFKPKYTIDQLIEKAGLNKDEIEII